MPHATTTDGLRIHYTLEGPSDAPAVVMLMGLGASGRYWFDAPDRLREDREHPHRVLVVDNRGTGSSDAPRRLFSMTRMADDVAQVMDHARIDRAYVVGMSMGGMIAQQLALRHPERVRGLALFCTTAGLRHGPLVHPRILRTLLSAPFVKKGQGERIVGDLLLAPSRRHEAATLLREWGPVMRAERVDAGMFFLQLGAVLTHRTGSALERIACPTIVVTGDSDVLVRPGHSRYLAKRIHGARLEVLSEVGHGIHSSDPDAVPRSLRYLRAKTEGRA